MADYRIALRIVLVALGATGLVLFAQTPPATPPANPTGGYEEVEDTDPPKTKKAVPIDEETPLVTVPRGAYYARIEELARASVDAKHPALREVIAKYVVAFDRLTDTADVTVRITPIPIYRTGKFPDVFGVFELSERNEPAPARRFEVTKLRKLEHYEEMVIDEAARLANPNGEPSLVPHTDRIAVAEQLLASAVFFYDGARDQSKRKGREWDRVRATLVERLADTRMKRLQLASERKDWKLVRSLGSRMATLYPTNLKLLEDVYAARLAEALNALAESDQAAELELSRDLLVDFESRFPGSKSAAAEQVRDALKQKAKRLFTLAEKAIKQNDKDAQRLLRTIEIIEPNHPGLRELQGQLTGAYSILTVGVRHLPELMTPLTARTDSERFAVELLFEPLLEALPDDPHGVKYRPALADGMPSTGGLVRDFDLVRQAGWSGLNREYFDAADVAATLKSLRQDYSHTWTADGLDWLTEQTRVEERSKLRIQFAAGHPYPLSLLTTKILPARWLASQNKRLDDALFARRPHGTGPFQLESTAQPGAPVVFTVNPSFGRRPGRLGQPFIKEVRFVDINKITDPAVQFRAGQLHMVPDVPTNELTKYSSADAKLTGVATVVSAASNRQIYMLAVNFHRQVTHSLALRRAIAHAIDREEILEKVYRAGFPQFHKALVGPYPVDAWATPRLPGVALPSLFNPNLSQAKFVEYAEKSGAVTLSLLFPNDDPRARAACDLIRKQIENVAGATVKISLTLEGLPNAEFHRRVYNEREFDLAYVPFEYRDDWYPFGLGSLLSPTATDAGGRNFMRYPPKSAKPMAEDELFTRQLDEIRHHADFRGKLIPKSREVHERFLAAMPFIPLWQLDRHMVVSTGLKVFFDDGAEPALPKWIPPATIFAGVSRWRLD